ncbi:hypothetical protein FRB99_005373 [Tulasnella sp. 403]|nr:hypothetical protein FRB99_005373 [Tulasnella sp. 403]
MYCDLNVPFGPTLDGSNAKSSNTKDKGKLKEASLTPKDQSVLDARIDLLVHLGFTVIALNQTVRGAYNPTLHPNTLLGVKPRDGILILRRLTIVLTDESDKGCGLVNSNTEALKSYDIIALRPTTHPSLSLACLTHSVPSPTAAHIISVDLTSEPREGFFRKQSLIQTAIKNGAVFEICYAPAVSEGSGDKGRLNWWVNVKELVRATKGKGIILSGGGESPDLRGPKDIMNLATLLGCKQDQAHAALTKTVESLMLRAQTRQTYRAVLSEPKLVMPVETENHPDADSASSSKRRMEESDEHDHEPSPAPPPKRPRKEKQKSRQK